MWCFDSEKTSSSFNVNPQNHGEGNKATNSNICHVPSGPITSVLLPPEPGSNVAWLPTGVRQGSGGLPCTTATLPLDSSAVCSAQLLHQSVAASHMFWYTDTNLFHHWQENKDFNALQVSTCWLPDQIYLPAWQTWRSWPETAPCSPKTSFLITSPFPKPFLHDYNH